VGCGCHLPGLWCAGVLHVDGREPTRLGGDIVASAALSRGQLRRERAEIADIRM
jgi:hypothetical protein